MRPSGRYMDKVPFTRRAKVLELRSKRQELAPGHDHPAVVHK